MAYPSASGTPSMSGTYTPEIWSGKLLEKFYGATVLAFIANTDYEGEIKDSGDTVWIRTLPDMIIRDYIKGQPLIADSPEPEKKALLINKGLYYNVAISDVDAKQSDIAFMDKWGADASQRIKLRQDTVILADIYADAGVDNAGTTAGKISGNINLGTTGAPLALANVASAGVAAIVDKVVECGQVLDEQDRPDEDRWIVLPAWACTRIKTSELKDASMTGDGKSTLRSGRIGMIDRWTIYSSNSLPYVTDGGARSFHCPFGHKSALTYASQFVKNEVLKNPNDFGDLMRGLHVFGWEVINPDSMGVLYAKAA
ncbi:MAG: hypothetical protein AAGU21_01030 [Solidesulfovibrio sp.]|uniref:hypothetical protein n=1 Tax=Solidesulfovibrio sp. TaxID=2910990 RepID=UPI003158ACFD